MQRLGSFALMLMIGAVACATPKKKIENPPPPPPQVAVSDPEVVLLDGALENDYLAADSEGAMIARIRIDTREADRDERPTLNLALAIDTSGSMEGDAIDNARAAARHMIDALRDGDRLSVVTFGSRVETLVPTTEVTPENRQSLGDAVAKMKAHGTTNMTGGLNQALTNARSGHLPEGVNRVVLLSDGVPNDETHIRSLADQAKQQSISVTAMGLGADYNETLLADLAQRSGGTFHYIEESEQVAEVFEQEVLRMERLVARNLQLALTPGPGVAVEQVIGHQATLSGRASYINLGNLSEGEQRDVFVRLAVGGHADGATIELMDIGLTFVDAVVNAGSLRRDLFMSAKATGDAAVIEKGVNTEIRREALRAEIAAVVVHAIAQARAGQLEQATQMLIAAEPRARQAAETYGDDSFTEQAEELVELRESLPSIAPKVQAAPQPQPQADHDQPAPQAEAPMAADAPASVRRNHEKAIEKFQAKPKYRAR